jgi:hypothetical protein
VLQLMDDLRSADVDFLTIGQYLQPTRKHHAVARFVPPDKFESYEKIAYARGFLLVSATPLTRSSHHAGDDFLRLRERRRGAGDQYDQVAGCVARRSELITCPHNCLVAGERDCRKS